MNEQNDHSYRFWDWESTANSNYDPDNMFSVNPPAVPFQPTPPPIERPQPMRPQPMPPRPTPQPPERPQPIPPRPTPQPPERPQPMPPRPTPQPPERPQPIPPRPTPPPIERPQPSRPPQVCLELPYPKPQATKPNEYYAQLIRSLYSGMVSELSATLQYFYQALQFIESGSDVHKTLMGISECQQHHLHLLGELLVALDTEPKFYSRLPMNANPQGWWSAHPSVIDYNDQLGEALIADVGAERKLIALYQYAIQQIEDDKINLLLRRLMMDDEEHIRTLMELYRRYCQ